MKYLTELLEKESTVYNHYLALAVKKKQALIDNDIDALEQINEEEKQISSKILALEAARLEFLRENGFKGNVTLSELLTTVPEEERNTLQNSASSLKEVLSECKKFTDTNMALMKQSSNYINHMIKIFTTNLNGGKPEATYKKGAYQFKPGSIADIQG